MHAKPKVVGRGLAPAEIQYTAYGKIAEEQLFLLEERYPSLRVDQYEIRGRADYEEIAEYIVNNPIQWKLDSLYSEAREAGW